MGPFGPALALGCRIVLAAVLAVAAVAKIADRRALPGQLRAMGLARPWDARLAVGLPVAELVVAVALIAAAHSELPALAAVVLLVAFTVFLVATIRRAVPCPCFGAVRAGKEHSGPAAIVRNGFLIALAVVATGSISGARPGGTVVAAAVGAAVAALAVTRVA
jgi:hypothetical protein